MKNFKLKALTAAVALMTVSGLAVADTTTTTTTTVVKEQAMTDATRFHITQFDLNNDNVYAKSEIGKKLFYIYDTDGNEVIDNLEFDDKRVLTVVPVEQETYTLVDSDNDGVAEQSRYSFSRVMEETGLAMYDEDEDGLSAEEFIGTYFRAVDKNDNKLIDVDEWKSMYLSSVDGMTESDRFNNE